MLKTFPYSHFSFEGYKSKFLLLIPLLVYWVFIGNFFANHGLYNFHGLLNFMDLAKNLL